MLICICSHAFLLSFGIALLRYFVDTFSLMYNLVYDNSLSCFLLLQVYCLS
jgi:hypothetical protein